jgi:hypothetical protein
LQIKEVGDRLAASEKAVYNGLFPLSIDGDPLWGLITVNGDQAAMEATKAGEMTFADQGSAMRPFLSRRGQQPETCRGTTAKQYAETARELAAKPFHVPVFVSRSLQITMGIDSQEASKVRPAEMMRGLLAYAQYEHEEWGTGIPSEPDPLARAIDGRGPQFWIESVRTAGNGRSLNPAEAAAMGRHMVRDAGDDRVVRYLIADGWPPAT